LAIARQLLVEDWCLRRWRRSRTSFCELGHRLAVALGPSIVPRAQEVNIDARVFGFMALAVAVISIGFGLVAARPFRSSI
jgi:hypothetical protein